MKKSFAIALALLLARQVYRNRRGM